MSRARKCSVETTKLLVAFLAHARKWQHGYELSKVTGLKSGTLYPILRRLSDRGYLESMWKESSELGRPPRHMYRLTRTGLALAKTQESLQECGRSRVPIPSGSQL